MIIEKVVAPENLNKEPYDTRWIADLEDGKQVWIQISKDIDKPNWLRLGEVFEQEFIRTCESDAATRKVITNSDNS